MPRASSQSSKAMKSGFGMQEGIAKVVAARFAVVQHSKKDGTLVTPFFGVLLDYVKCDETGEAENPDDIMTKDLPIQWVAKNKDWSEKDANADSDYDVPQFLFDKLKFHPGKAKGPEDTDPEDLGVEVGTEGNMMWSESDNITPFQDCDWIEFCKSLESKGFKPEINDQSFAPNYVGMVFKFHTENKPLRKDAKTDEKPQTKWVVDQIYVRPYEKKGTSAAKSTAKPATTAAGKKAASAPAPAAVESNGTGDAANGAFTAALEKLLSSPGPATKAVSKRLKEESEGVKLTEFMRAIANELMLSKVDGKTISGSVQKEVINSMKVGATEDEPGWIEQAGAGTVVVDREAETVSLVG